MPEDIDDLSASLKDSINFILFYSHLPPPFFLFLLASCFEKLNPVPLRPGWMSDLLNNAEWLPFYKQNPNCLGIHMWTCLELITSGLSQHRWMKRLTRNMNDSWKSGLSKPVWSIPRGNNKTALFKWWMLSGDRSHVSIFLPNFWNSLTWKTLFDFKMARMFRQESYQEAINRHWWGREWQES